MKKIDLRFRQVHLDFHTSKAITGIGSEFDPDEFASTVEKAKVNSITCFARCHHGWIYFDTELFPERRHPHLTRDLLREQIEACHARNIRVPIYITVQWDHLTANQHPEWLIMNDQGCISGTPPYQAGFYRRICLNTPYVDFLKKHVQEVLETLPTDGIFFDIVAPQECSCKYCREGMIDAGLDPTDPQVRRDYATSVVNNFKRDMTGFVRQFNQDCSIFYNAGHVGPKHRVIADAYTHFELESLPSGGWGYMHFPLTQRYARNLGLDCMGMTGKFHTSWGDFHSFKNKQALQFECFNMLALGAKCSIGDQLPPTGKICQTTYNLIGSVYSEVEKKEPWCAEAKPVVDIGVFTPEEFVIGRHNDTAMGVIRILQEGAHQFDIIDSATDISEYKAVILPDNIPVSDEFARKLEGYLGNGGALIASYKSGLNTQGNDFALKALGIKLKGDAPYSPDFIVPKGKIGKELPETEHVMYMKGLEVEPEAGSEVLADAIVPYFNRTYKHFCSHRHTPSSGKPGYPAVVQKGRAIYFIHPIFAQYNKNAPRWCKTLVLNALDILLPNPLMLLEAPTTTLATVNQQASENRWVVHLLHYIPERRGQDFDIIEDVIPIFNVKVSVKAPKGVQGVVCVPEQESLEFQENNGRIEFVLPKLEGHQMIALNFV
jgi:hypothetical protein